MAQNIGVLAARGQPGGLMSSCRFVRIKDEKVLDEVSTGAELLTVVRCLLFATLTIVIHS